MRRLLTIVFALSLLLVFGTPASANHSWGDYKWDTTSLILEDNLDDSWDLTPVVADWDVSTSGSPLGLTHDTTPDASTVCGGPLDAESPANPGWIEVCNGDWGANGWLGVARIWIDDSDGVTITAAVAAVNDYYLGPGGAYDNANARRHVLCQEVGHTFGLDHQKRPRDASCMNDRWGLFELAYTTPNDHDYEQLNAIYASSGGGGGGGDEGTGGPDCANKPPNHPKCQNPHTTFEVERLANGGTVLTWITWAPGHGPSDR